MKYKILAALLTTLTIAEYQQEQTAEELAYQKRLRELVLEGDNLAMALSMSDNSSSDDSYSIRNFNMLGAIILLSVALATLIVL